MVRGVLSSDHLVEAPASAVWSAYSGLELPRLITELLSDVLGVAEVVQGDGGVGTVIRVTSVPGSAGPGDFIDVYTKVDDEARVKEKETVEGGFRALGFSLYRMRFEVMEKGESAAVIRSTVEYEVEDEEKAKLVSMKPLELIAEAVGKFVVEKRNM
uniref:Bet v I/Major latex protein domain-containing protein n=1 Tax=Kalanchoe fedtschenkoi TaxID=63787 RepID=A0A7N1A0S5_KALFE